MIDTHCHLTFKDLYSNRARVIADAVAAGVSRMITIACTPGEIETAMQVRREHPNVFVAAGIHPHEAGKVSDDDIRQLESAWKAGGIVAAGEMGLDYHYNFSPHEQQQTVFRKQLDAAAPLNLPIIIHCREAHTDVVRLLSAQGYDHKRVVFHCFSGTAEEAMEIRDHGWRTSFTGIITFKNAEGPRQACIDTPIDQLMFETDAPYLSPEPVRKMRPNEPKNVAHTIRFAAEARGEPFDVLAATSTKNAGAFFALDA